MVIDSIAHIRRYPEIYFGAGHDPSACGLVTRLIDDAIALGVVLPVHCDFVSGWWIVAAREDWVLKSNPLSLIDTFHQLRSFPEMGRNCYRSNVLVTAFADDVIVFGTQGRSLIKGNDLGSDELVKHIDEKYLSHRIVAFRKEGWNLE